MFTFTNIHDPSIEIYNTSKNLDEVLYRLSDYFRARAELGETNIEVREFFFVMADLMSTTTEALSKAELEVILKNFLMSLCRKYEKSPFKLVVADPSYGRERIQPIVGLNLGTYASFLVLLFKVIEDIRTYCSSKEDPLNMPKVEIICPVYQDVRTNQLQYLSSLFALPTDTIKKHTRSLPSLSEETSQLISALELLEEESKRTCNIQAALMELKRMGKESSFITYPSQRIITDLFKNQRIPRKCVARDRVKCSL